MTVSFFYQIGCTSLTRTQFFSKLVFPKAVKNMSQNNFSIIQLIVIAQG
jgi:hypothetical protein